MEWIQENVLFLITLLIIFFILVLIIKSLIRMALGLLVIAAIAVLIATTVYDVPIEKIITLGHDTVEKTTKVYENKIAPIIESELKDAEITMKEDGDFTIRTTSLIIEGNQNEELATITYKEITIEVPIAEIKEYVKKYSSDAKEMFESNNEQTTTTP